MTTIAKVSGYDAIMMQRARRADAAALAEQRSSSRQAAAQKTLAQSDNLRNTVANTINQDAANQSQLTAQIIRTRMATDAKAKAESNKWYS